MISRRRPVLQLQLFRLMVSPSSYLCSWPQGTRYLTSCQRSTWTFSSDHLFVMLNFRGFRRWRVDGNCQSNSKASSSHVLSAELLLKQKRHQELSRCNQVVGMLIRRLRSERGVLMWRPYPQESASGIRVREMRAFPLKSPPTTTLLAMFWIVSSKTIGIKFSIGL